MKGNLGDLLQTILGYLANVCKKCLNGGGVGENLNVSLNLEESESRQKISDRTLVRLSLADRKLTAKELARKLKDGIGVKCVFQQ